MSQAEIARFTDLSKATVNLVVQALRDDGVVEYRWKNRREALVTLISKAGSILSLLVHEKFVSASLFDLSNKKRVDFCSSKIRRFDKSNSSPSQVVEIIQHLAQTAETDGAPLIGISLAIEGPIESATGAVAPWAWPRLPNWKRINIRNHFKRHVRVPLVIDNDANFAALAEWTWGAGRGCDDFLYISCGEGIGGGFVLNGKNYRGGSGLAGEIGHMIIESNGDLCFCGSRGCLTSLAAERSILKALGDGGRAHHSLDDVVARAEHGDAACQRVISETGLHLGKALATVVRILGPSKIAIGGTLGQAGNILLDGVRGATEVINLRAIGQSPEFVIAALGEYAVELGGLAAVLAELDMGLSAIDDWMME